MTSFNESAINRDDDGKFAAKTTGETDPDTLSNDPSLTPVSERVGEEISPDQFDTGTYSGEFGPATIERERDGSYAARTSMTEKIGPFGDAEITRSMAQDYADDSSDDRGGSVEPAGDGGWNITRNMSARYGDGSDGIIDLPEKLDAEGFNVNHDSGDQFDNWASTNGRWGESESDSTASSQASANVDDDPNADVDIDAAMGEGDHLTVHPDETNDGEILEPVYVSRTASGFRVETDQIGSTGGSMWTKNLAKDAPNVNEDDYAAFVRSQYGAELAGRDVDRTEDGGFVASPTFVGKLGVDASTSDITKSFKTEKYDTYIHDRNNEDALAAKFYAWKVTMDDAERGAERSWNGHGRSAPFPRDAFRASAMADPTRARETAALWEAGRNNDGTPIA